MTVLDQTQATLLLLLMIFEKDRLLDLLKYLEPGEAKLLEERAKELLEMPESQRLQPLINGVKTFLYHQFFSGLPFDDVPRLLTVLRDELPATVGLILRYLPERVAAEVCQKLSTDIVTEIPDQQDLERVSNDVVLALRHEFQRIYFNELYGYGS